MSIYGDGKLGKRAPPPLPAAKRRHRVAGSILTDLQGFARIQCPAVDLGAYELTVAELTLPIPRPQPCCCRSC